MWARLRPFSPWDVGPVFEIGAFLLDSEIGPYVKSSCVSPLTDQSRDTLSCTESQVIKI